MKRWDLSRGCLGTIVAVLEFVGGPLIVAGLLTQVIALLLAVQMAVAILKVNLKGGFAGGYEFDLLLRPPDCWSPSAEGIARLTLSSGWLFTDARIKPEIFANASIGELLSARRQRRRTGGRETAAFIVFGNTARISRLADYFPDVFLSWLIPAFVAVFIILFDVYWLLKTVFLSFHLRGTFRKMRLNLENRLDGQTRRG